MRVQQRESLFLEISTLERERERRVCVCNSPAKRPLLSYFRIGLRTYGPKKNNLDRIHILLKWAPLFQLVSGWTRFLYYFIFEKANEIHAVLLGLCLL